MVRNLQFAPSTLFPLESTCKYTQPCAIYRWCRTQFHHSSTLEWLLVRSDGVRVGQLIYDDFHVTLLFFRWHCWWLCDLKCWLAAKPRLFPLYSWYHCTCDKPCGTSPRQTSDHIALPSCQLILKILLFLFSSLFSVPPNWPLIYLHT